jgi:hypothetical protein
MPALRQRIFASLTLQAEADKVQSAVSALTADLLCSFFWDFVFVQFLWLMITR